MTTNQPSVAAMGLTKSELITLADSYRQTAQEAHDAAQGWRNRCLIAEARLATLRAAYEPQP